MLAGQVIVWLVVSILLTKNEQLKVLPLPSLAVNTTVLMPTPEMVIPEGGDCVVVGNPQLSAVVAEYDARVAEQAAPKVTVCVAGQVTVGAVLSVRVTLNEQLLVLPFPSLAVNTTVLDPTPDTEVPEMGDCVTVTVPQLSAVLTAL